MLVKKMQICKEPIASAPDAQDHDRGGIADAKPQRRARQHVGGIMMRGGDPRPGHACGHDQRGAHRRRPEHHDGCEHPDHGHGVAAGEGIRIQRGQQVGQFRRDLEGAGPAEPFFHDGIDEVQQRGAERGADDDPGAGIAPSRQQGGEQQRVDPAVAEPRNADRQRLEQRRPRGPRHPAHRPQVGGLKPDRHAARERLHPRAAREVERGFLHAKRGFLHARRGFLHAKRGFLHAKRGFLHAKRRNRGGVC